MGFPSAPVAYCATTWLPRALTSFISLNLNGTPSLLFSLRCLNLDEPTKRKSSKIGESRASNHYGHNTDVDETVLGALITQYMLTGSAPEVVLITEQVNADGLSVKIEEQKVADLKTVPVEQHPAMLQAIAEFNDLIGIGTFADL